MGVALLAVGPVDLGLDVPGVMSREASSSRWAEMLAVFRAVMLKQGLGVGQDAIRRHAEEVVGALADVGEDLALRRDQPLVYDARDGLPPTRRGSCPPSRRSRACRRCAAAAPGSRRTLPRGLILRQQLQAAFQQRQSIGVPLRGESNRRRASWNRSAASWTGRGPEPSSGRWLIFTTLLDIHRTPRGRTEDEWRSVPAVLGRVPPLSVSTSVYYFKAATTLTPSILTALPS